MTSPASPPRAVECKVFVGNLSYTVTADTLRDLFQTVGDVKDVQLISRYGRSKGYGFVTFNDTRHVQLAVDKFTTYELEGRQINCESAREKKEKTIEQRLDDSTLNDHTEDEKLKKRAPRKKPQNNKQKHQDAAAAAEPASTQSTEKTEKKPQRERKPREPREPRDKDAPISKTMVFVGNLPFEVTDEDLSAMFEKYGVVSARVVFGRFGRSKGFGFFNL
jgi:RNA recognition motif-containing protein